MPSPRPLTADDIDLAIVMYSEGKSLAVIGEHFGVSHGVIWHRLKTRGVATRPRGSRGSKEAQVTYLSPEQVEQAIDLYVNKKFSLPRIAETLQTHPPAVRKYLVERGVIMRPVHLGEAQHDREAIQIVNDALFFGLLQRGPCEHVITEEGREPCVCGVAGFLLNNRPAVIAHHDDYNFPLRVRWLCFKHHREWHQFNSAVPRTDNAEYEKWYQDMTSRHSNFVTGPLYVAGSEFSPALHSHLLTLASGSARSLTGYEDRSHTEEQMR